MLCNQRTVFGTKAERRVFKDFYFPPVTKWRSFVGFFRSYGQRARSTVHKTTALQIFLSVPTLKEDSVTFTCLTQLIKTVLNFINCLWYNVKRTNVYVLASHIVSVVVRG